MENNVTWRETIRTIGESRVARMMGVKYPTVYRYTKEGSTYLPRSMAQRLCDTMEKFLTAREFKQFKNSLKDDMVRFS
jgi:hypothetical protein